MKKILLGGLAVVALAMPAVAADMKVKAPLYTKAPAAPIHSWTGFYLGIEGGGGWGHAEQTDSLPFDSGRFNVSGGLVGGTLGYNWQVNQFVLGLEGDGSASWIKGTTSGTNPVSGPCGGAPANCNANLQALGTIRGRVGIAFDRFLPFVTGGAAIGSLHGNEGTVPAAGAVGSGTATVSGWTAGGGVEMMFAPNWSAKVEYLHVDLGNQGIFTDALQRAPFNISESIKFTADIVRGGLNYKF